MTPEEKRALQLTAVSVREGILTSTHGAKAGHPGGSLSAADVFTYLYFQELNIDPKNPKWEERDRFVLSKGHTAPGLYAALALRGFFPVDDLPTLRHIDSYLQGHPNMNTVPGVDMSTGSLGQGISAAAGMTVAARSAIIRSKTAGSLFHVFILLPPCLSILPGCRPPHFPPDRRIPHPFPDPRILLHLSPPCGGYPQSLRSFRQ